MKFISTIISVLLIILPLSCNVIDIAIDNVVDFSGIFETDQGWLVELVGSDGKIISLGSNPYPEYRKVGDRMIMSADYVGNNTWHASVRALDGFFESVDDLKIENEQLTFSTSGTFRVWKKHKEGDKPNNEDPDNDDDDLNPGGLSTVILDNNLYGNQDSKKILSFTLPTGVKKLEITLEENSDGRQLADMFVKRGSSPSVTRNNYTNKGWTADCASVRPNRDAEECVFSNPSSGTWYVLVYGYHAFDGATLKIKLTQ